MIFTPPNPEKEEGMRSRHMLFIGCECACMGMVSVFRGLLKGKKKSDIAWNTIIQLQKSEMGKKSRKQFTGAYFFSVLVGCLVHWSIITVQAALQMSNILCWRSQNWKRENVPFSKEWILLKSQNFLKYIYGLKIEKHLYLQPELCALESISPKWVKCKKRFKCSEGWWELL